MKTKIPDLENPHSEVRTPHLPKPLGGRILVEILPAETHIAGLEIPEEYRKKSEEGIVRALGPCRYSAKGVPLPFEVAVGDRVIVAKFDVPRLKLPQGEWSLPDSDHILAVLDDGKPKNGLSAAELAGKLYTVYCAAVGGKAFDGNPLPSWREFANDPAKVKQSDAWIKVAEFYKSERK